MRTVICQILLETCGDMRMRTVICQILLETCGGMRMRTVICQTLLKHVVACAWALSSARHCQKNVGAACHMRMHTVDCLPDTRFQKHVVACACALLSRRMRTVICLHPHSSALLQAASFTHKTQIYCPSTIPPPSLPPNTNFTGAVAIRISPGISLRHHYTHMLLNTGLVWSYQREKPTFTPGENSKLLQYTYNVLSK